MDRVSVMVFQEVEGKEEPLSWEYTNKKEFHKAIDALIKTFDKIIIIPKKGE